MNWRVDAVASKLLGRERWSRWYHSARIWLLPSGVRSRILRRYALGEKLDRPNRFEARYYSQHGEDGITAAILQKVGTTNRYCVEFGVSDGSESCTAYFVRRQGWSYLWMDRSDAASPPIKKEFVTAENIKDLLAKYGVPSEFDLLSVDIDYNTYWIWKAMEGFYPRVVIIEYNPAFPPNESLAVPYNPSAVWDGTDYYGASLLALVKLGAQKGYRLVACDSSGTNAFFVRNSLEDRFVIRGTEEIYRPANYGPRVHGRYLGHRPSHRPFLPV